MFWFCYCRVFFIIIVRLIQRFVNRMFYMASEMVCCLNGTQREFVDGSGLGLFSAYRHIRLKKVMVRDPHNQNLFLWDQIL
jgi:hypothetical protein